MTRRDWISYVAFATCPVWVLPFGWWLAFTPWSVSSGVGWVLVQAELFGLLMALPAAALVLASPVMLLFRNYRRKAAVYGGLSLLYLGSFVGGVVCGRLVWRDRIVQFDARSQPLVAAIRAFEATNGRPPHTLDELVPAHLPEVPQTGIGKWPKFEYRTKPGGVDHGNPWVLEATPPNLVMGFDTMLYFPDQNYPREGYGGTLEKFQTWAYVHE